MYFPVRHYWEGLMAIVDVLGQVPHSISTLILPFLVWMRLTAGGEEKRGGALWDGLS